MNMSLEALNKKFEETMNEFEKRLDKANDKPGNSQGDLSSLRGDFNAFKKKMTSEISALQENVAQLELRVDAIDAASRKNLLLLHGVKEDESENTRSLVTTVLTGLECPEDAIKGIVSTRRLGRAIPKKNRPILIEFQYLNDRRSVWERKKGLKNSSLLLTESLTKTRQKLFSSARSTFSNNKCWTSDGTVMVLLPDGTKRAISTQKQLDVAAVLLTKPVKPSASTNTSTSTGTGTSTSSSSPGLNIQHEGSRSIGLRSKTNTKK